MKTSNLRWSLVVRSQRNLCLRSSTRLRLSSNALLSPGFSCLLILTPGICKLYAQCSAFPQTARQSSRMFSLLHSKSHQQIYRWEKMASFPALHCCRNQPLKCLFTPLYTIPSRKRKFICFCQLKRHGHRNVVTTISIRDPNFLSKFTPKIECAHLFVIFLLNVDHKIGMLKLTEPFTYIAS